MRARLFASVLVCSVVACGGGATERLQVRVADHRVPCVGEALQACLLVSAGDAAEAELHYGGIVGFEHRLGFAYALEVDQVEVAHPPADGSSLEWRLVSVVQETQATDGASFSVELSSDMLAALSVDAAAGSGELIGQPFLCAPTACEAAAAAASGDASVTLQFVFEGAGPTLRLTGVSPASE